MNGPRSQSTVRLRRAIASIAATCLVLVLGVASPAIALAKALTPVTQKALPAPPDATPLLGIATVGDAPVLVTATGLWQLSADGAAWRAVALPATAGAWHPMAVASDDGAAYVLFGSDLSTRSDAAIVVRALSIDGGRAMLSDLPALPAPLYDARLAVHDKQLTVAGRADGQGARVFQLDAAAPKPAWESRAPWPGGAAPRALAVQTSAVFLAVEGADGEHLLRWKADGGWTDRGRIPGTTVAGIVRATGQAHLLFLLRANAAPGAVAGAGTGPARLTTFQTITNAWADLPGATATQPVAGGAWKDGLVWADAGSGATGAAPTLASAQIQSTKVLLRWMDWLVIVVYLGGMIGIGLYFYLREKRNSTASFFVGGRSIPFWAAGVSLYAANTSSISFIAIPAKAFETNWQYLTNNLIAVTGLMFVAVWIVPLLRRLDLMSVFSYLETRFHPGIRMMASGLAILTQIGSRMSVILLLPALAISTITGINVTLSIVLMGGFTIIYTAMGGMKAVIWTDFVQVIVKMGGAIFAICFMIWSLKGGFGQFWQQAQAEDKMHLFDFSFDLTKATVWGFVFLVLFDVVLTFPKDQVLMQRTLSTKSDRDAGRSIWAMAAIMIPGGFVFYGIGTALFVYYKNNPERMNPLLPVDATFPLFIGAELPPGVTGLIIAGIFAAAMATLSGIMNSVSTLVSVDFYERLRRDRHSGDKTQKQSVFFAEVMTVVVGLAGIGVAIVLSKFDVHSLFDVSIELAGLLGGGFAGAYTLGMFTRRANSPGVAVGIAFSIVLTLVAWHYKLVHPYFYLAISILLCIVFGYLASLFFPAPARSLAGLTIYARDKLPSRPE